MSMPETVQSVVQSERNGPLIAAAAQLWLNDNDRVLDMTYGRGRFWTEYRPDYMCTNDIDPETDAFHHEDFRKLSFAGGSFDVVVYDPPYILRGGDPTTSTVEDFNARYGLERFQTMDELRLLILDGLREAIRVTSDRLLVKCTDQISSGRFVGNHHWIVGRCLERGLEQVDEFVHYSGTGPGSWERQLHSRRAHSFLCIFRK